MARGVAVLVASAALLAGCGGRGASFTALPPGAPGVLSPQSTNVNLFNGTLWFGEGPNLRAVPLMQGGVGASVDGTLDGIVDAAAVRMTIAPDGTLYDLVASDGDAWRLQIYAPGSRGAAQPEQFIEGKGYPIQVLLVGDGIDVVSTVGAGTRSAAATVWTYAYAAGNRPRPIRSLSLGPDVSDVAADGKGRLYAAHSAGEGITVFAAGASDPTAPIRRIATRTRSADGIAIAPDGTVYLLTNGANAAATTIDAYAPGATGPAASRTIGPYPAAHGAVKGGMTVDSDGNLYVGFQDAQRATSVYELGPTAQGSAAALRQFAVASGNLNSIAIGPLIPAPATLYVGARDHVLAYDPDAAGVSSPQRTITGLGGPNVLGLLLATRSNGELWVMQSAPLTSNVGGCSITVESPTADGANGVLQTFDCGGPRGAAIARGAADGMDLVVQNEGASTYRVRRLGSTAGDFQIPPAYGPNIAVATDAAGNMFIGAGDRVDVFSASAPSGAAPMRSIGLFAGKRVGYLAVAPDGRVYAMVYNNDAFGYHFLQSVAPGGSSSSDLIVSFLDVQPIVGFGVDRRGSVYVGEESMVSPYPNIVAVWGPDASGQIVGQRELDNVVPASSFRGLTLSP